MGKVRRKREKLHFSVKSNPTKSESIPQETANCNFVVEPSENLFAGLDIPMDKLANFSDARSTTSTASTKRREEKRRIRLETFIHSKLLAKVSIYILTISQYNPIHQNYCRGCEKAISYCIFSTQNVTLSTSPIRSG